MAVLGALPVVYLVILSPPAVAAPGVVVLLQPTPASAGVRRCMTRIRDELTTDGLNVTILDRGPSNDPFSVAEALGRERGSLATITLMGDPDRGPAELWIVDRIAGHGAVRRIVAPTDELARVPEILAVRALEILRASALELLVLSNRAASDQAKAAPTVVSPAPVSSPVRAPVRSDEEVGFAIETGVSLLQSVGGPGLAVVPLVRFQIQSTRAWFARLSLAGLGTQPRVEAAQGSARVGHELALIEVGAAFRRDKRVRPVVSVGAGALRVTVDGDGSWPYEGRRGGHWATAVGGAAGIMAKISAQLSLAVELHVLWAAPYPVVRFSGADAATVGRPAVFAAITLGAWL
jgi:hypothetical protein